MSPKPSKWRLLYIALAYVVLAASPTQVMAGDWLTTLRENVDEIEKKGGAQWLSDKVTGRIKAFVWENLPSLSGPHSNSAERVQKAGARSYGIRKESIDHLENGYRCFDPSGRDIDNCSFKEWNKKSDALLLNAGWGALRDLMPDKINELIDAIENGAANLEWIGGKLDRAQDRAAALRVKLTDTLDSARSYFEPASQPPPSSVSASEFKHLGSSESIISERDLQGIGGRNPGSSSSSLITDQDLQGIGGQRSKSSVSASITDEDLQGIGAPLTLQKPQKPNWGEESARLREEIDEWNQQQKAAEMKRQEELERKQQVELARKTELERQQQAAWEAEQERAEAESRARSSTSSNSDIESESGWGSFFGAVLKGAAEGYLMGKHGIPPSSFSGPSSSSRSRRSGGAGGASLDSQCPGARERIDRIVKDAEKRMESVGNSISGSARLMEQAYRKGAAVYAGCPQTPEIVAARQELEQLADQAGQAARQAGAE